jgi:hemolysin activation/secretion protein
MKRLTGGSALLAVLLLCTQPSWAQTPKFTIQSFEISGNTLLSAAALRAAVAPYTGEGRDMADVTKAAEAVRRRYAAAGYPIVQVFPPEQTVSGGVISLRIIEGRIAKLSVAGNAAYDPANIRASLPTLQEGVSPNAADVVADIVLANENPAKQVAVNFQAGVTAGDVDARIDVTEERIEKYTLSYDNGGAQAAGFNRVALGYQNANVGNRDHMLSLAVNTTVENPDRSLSFVAGYRIPFYRYGVSLDLIGSYSNSKTETSSPAGSLNFSGRGTYLGVRLNQALPSVGELRHKVVYGLDYKDFANQCVLGGNAMASCGTVTAQPLSVAYVAQMATPALQTGGTLSYSSNLQGGMHGTDADYDIARAGAPNHWDVWRGNAFIGLPLPEDWQFRAAASFQESSKLLIPAEQFGIGGASSVRGYAERAVAGDQGYVANIEFYTPDFGKYLADNIKSRVVFFFDHGSRRNNGESPQPVVIESVGLGLRLNYGKDIAVKADLGFSLTPDAFQSAGTRIATMPARQAWGLKPDNERWGLHLSATYSF